MLILLGAFAVLPMLLPWLVGRIGARAFYVGALGSRVNNDKRRERLLEFDLTAGEIARLHGPVGLWLGSKTPPEIAVSVLAEMTAVKNGVPIVQSQMTEARRLDFRIKLGADLWR